MEGKLFCYDSQRRLVAFESGLKDGNNYNNNNNDNNDNFLPISLIIVGGMTDGLLSSLAIPEQLEKLCNDIGITVIQVLLSSSYRSFGISSLAQDAEELGKLITYLRMRDNGKRRFILLGHSTGCHDIIWYLKNKDNDKDKDIIGIILHGGISDRDYLQSSLPNYNQLLQWAEEKCNLGQVNELYPTFVFGVPMTAYRLKSLFSVGGDDDFFSFDLDPNHLKTLFNCINVPCLVTYSGDDEYTPNKLVYQKLATAYPPHAIIHTIQGADHSISNTSCQEIFYNLASKFIKDTKNQLLNS